MLLELTEVHCSYQPPGMVERVLSLGRASGAWHAALRGVSIQVRPGEIVGLLGPGGSGKSTLLRCAAGLLRPHSGEVRLMGRDPVRNAEVRGEMGLVLRGRHRFFSRVSGRENLRFHGRLQGLRGKALEARVDEVIAVTDLGSWATRSWRTYGAGVRQRMNLARALLGRPALLALDETTIDLQPPRRDALHAFITRLVEEEERGVIFATRDLTEAQFLCNRVLLLDGGRLVAEGDYMAVEPKAEALLRRGMRGEAGG